MNRRSFLNKLAAAGVAIGTANPLWESTKLISIPSSKIFTGSIFNIDQNGNITVNTHAKQDTVTVLELHRWLSDMSDRVDGDYLDITSPMPSVRVTDNIIELNKGFYVNNPEYLTEGSLKQKDEMWAGIRSVGEIQEDSYALINGKRAIRPGHINQCVKVESEEQSITMTTRRLGYKCNTFTIQRAYQGLNFGAILEQKDLIA